MSKFASFGFVVLLFLLLSGVVFFGFFILTPKIKEYRGLNMGLQEKSADVTALEQAFSKQYLALRTLQEKEANIDIALNKHFDQTQFQAYMQRYFVSMTLQSIAREQSGGLLVNRLDVHAKIASPTEYYRFIDALNSFEWVVEVGDTLQFKGEEDEIETHFTLNVYTNVP
jgi:hypothetical protein